MQCTLDGGDSGPSLVLLEQLQYADDDVIDVTKPRGLQTHKIHFSALKRFTAYGNDTDTRGCVLTSNFLA